MLALSILQNFHIGDLVFSRLPDTKIGGNKNMLLPCFLWIASLPCICYPFQFSHEQNMLLCSNQSYEVFIYRKSQYIIWRKTFENSDPACILDPQVSDIRYRIALGLEDADSLAARGWHTFPVLQFGKSLSAKTHIDFCPLNLYSNITICQNCIYYSVWQCLQADTSKESTGNSTVVWKGETCFPNGLMLVPNSERSQRLWEPF